MTMFYFSGTGNSKYIAELFSDIMSVACHSIEEDIDFKELIDTDDTIGFCYPIYFSRVPRIMREFVFRHRVSLKNKKLIIFCTQQILSGDGTRAFEALLPHKYTEVMYTEHFFMPSNIWPVATNSAKIKRCFDQSKYKMEAVCGDIKAGIVKKRGFGTISRALGLIQAPLLMPFEKKANNMVKVASGCTQCQLCVSICPMKNLVYENGKIKHKHDCTMCFRCVNKCPHKAITALFHGKVKKQYKGLGDSL
jgi:ferredoxin